MRRKKRLEEKYYLKFGNKMSRIGRRTIEIPEGVTVKVDEKGSRFGGDLVEVTGPKGSLSMEMRPAIKMTVNGNEVIFERKKDTPQVRSQHGLYNSLFLNMVLGVTEGFSKTVVLKGIGYKIVPKGQDLEISVGFSHTILFKGAEGITFTVEDNGTTVTVTGIDKQLVGDMAARIRSIKVVEPYKGKGFKYVDEEVKRKPGKAAAATSAG